MTRCGVSTAGLSSPFGGTSRAEAEHELAQPRPVFGPLPACRSRDVAGYHLRMHPKAETDPVEEGQAARRTPARSSVVIGAEHAEKPLTTQALTRRGSAARTACTHAPLERRSCHCDNGDGRGGSVSPPSLSQVTPQGAPRQQRTNVWHRVTRPARGEMRIRSGEPYRQRGAISCSANGHRRVRKITDEHRV